MEKHPFYTNPITQQNEEELQEENGSKLYKEDISRDDFFKNDLIFSKFRLSLEGGYAYWFYPVPENIEKPLQDHVKSLKNGMDLGADFCIYFSPELGVGIKFSNFFSNNTLENIAVYDQNDSLLGYSRLRQDINIRYLGPFITGRSFLMNNKVIATGSLSAGWMSYEENFTQLTSFFNQWKHIGY